MKAIFIFVAAKQYHEGTCDLAYREVVTGHPGKINPKRQDR